MALVISADGWRGSTVSYAKIATALAERGHRVRLFTSAPAVTGAYAAAGLAVTEMDSGGSRLALARALRRALVAARVEVVIVDRPRDARVAALAAPGTGARVVYRYNNHHRRPPGDLLVRLAYATGIVRETVFQTRAGRADALAQLPLLAWRPSRIVQNGVDVERFRPDPGAGAAYRARLGLGDGPLLLTVGALSAEKRHADTLAAVALAALLAASRRQATIGAAARERAVRDFSLAAMGDGYERLVQEVAAG